MLDLVSLAIFDASQFFQWFVENANYLFVFLFMVIESSFIPFPSEVVVPPAAYLACTNTGAGADMNIFMVVVMATLGALAGAFINYYLALWIGRPVVYAFADSRVGHMLMINRAKVEKAEAYFDIYFYRTTYSCYTTTNFYSCRNIQDEHRAIRHLHFTWSTGMEYNSRGIRILAFHYSLSRPAFHKGRGV